ncbi:ABC transporter permease [Lysinibacillus telephonicus]|uniref:ABC transporter permease n=1 Tax=Lysinibacillus telephonicus TaxID=1714840 RepID=A0A431UXS3_9BACI|nr:ABC transporter permease [Lysinibacillus telephonicus]RTQ96260.1 ABC transporter permease [Lysinibacillus telephonicus]
MNEHVIQQTDNIEKHTLSNKLLANISKFRELGLIVFIVILCAFIQWRNSSFLTIENINDMITNAAILSILAVGMMLVLVTRGIDLSIGAIIALSGMICAQLVSQFSLNPLLIILIGIVIGIVCGVLNGVLIAKIGILPIIATLALMNVFRGLTYRISNGEWVSSYQMTDSFLSIATGKVFGINNLIVIAIVIYIIFYYVINHTVIGRQIYAVGSNPESAKVSGINENKILILVYSTLGGLSGLAGVLWVSKFASAQGDTATGYELTVIAVCILGGVSIAGGAGKVSGVLLGALLLGILQNALPLLNVSPFWQTGIQGAIILIAVILNTLVKRSVDRNNLVRRKI